MDITSYLLGKKAGGGGGGGSTSLNWEQIGFSSTPQSIIDGYNYAKTIQLGYSNNKNYQNDNNLVYFPYVDSTGRTSFNDTFSYCSSLEEIALIDLSSAETTYDMFYECRALKRIPQFNTSKVENFSMMFNTCKSLKEVPILDTSNATNMSFMFTTCNNLSDISLNNIMRMCINATKMSSNKTLQRIGLTQAQATKCQTLSNYQEFVEAGWTTGY